MREDRGGQSANVKGGTEAVALQANLSFLIIESVGGDDILSDVVWPADEVVEIKVLQHASDGPQPYLVWAE